MMAKKLSNPVTNEEVAVVRNLLKRDGAKLQTINGQINARRRKLKQHEINQARISDIKTGHKRYAGINPASDEEVQAFFNVVGNDSPITAQEPSPVSENSLRALLPLRVGVDDVLAISETDRIECKLSFANNFFNNCVKAIAAFANNQGGYIIFGVKDDEWTIEGINKTAFEGFDRAKLTNALRDCMIGEIRFDMGTLDFSGKTVGALYVYPAAVQPVIFTNRKGDISSGDIYYRYNGANLKIGPTELQQIIENRVAALSQSVLGKHISNIMANGIENSAILNLSTGEVDGKGGKFAIDQKALSKVAFVKEGQFVETSGAPTLTLIGEIQERVVSNLDLYPFSYTESLGKVRNQVPEIKQNEFNQLIRDNNIKTNRAYSSVRYTSTVKQKKFNENGTISSGEAYIYNQSAIDFLVKKAKEIADIQASRTECK